MKKILITGASGFIGKELTKQLALYNKVIAIYHKNEKTFDNPNIVSERLNLSDENLTFKICKKYLPDIIIHCAGIAHQKVGSVKLDDYMRINSIATENLAKAGAKLNINLHFIFLSSVCVYGEPADNSLITETNPCNPSSDYAISKLDAENRLIKLFKKTQIKKLDILRIAPVYDYTFSLNLDRRVFGPKKTAYLRFSSGEQKMSALARSNLIDFVEFIVKKNNSSSQINIMNVCDFEPYTFNKIIKIFKNSKKHPKRPVIKIPLSIVYFATRLAGLCFPEKKRWLHSCYNKLACDLVFDNNRMRATGFYANQTLETIFR